MPNIIILKDSSIRPLSLSVSYKTRVTALCAVTAIPFYADVTVDYVLNENILEFESFDAYLLSFAEYKYTIESLTFKIGDVLKDLLNSPYCSVVLEAFTPVHGNTQITYVYQK